MSIGQISFCGSVTLVYFCTRNLQNPVMTYRLFVWAISFAWNCLLQNISLSYSCISCSLFRCHFLRDSSLLTFLPLLHQYLSHSSIFPLISFSEIFIFITFLFYLLLSSVRTETLIILLPLPKIEMHEWFCFK